MILSLGKVPGPLSKVDRILIPKKKNSLGEIFGLRVSFCLKKKKMKLPKEYSILFKLAQIIEKFLQWVSFFFFTVTRNNPAEYFYYFE